MDIKADAIKVMWALIKLMKTQKAVAKALGQSKQTFNYWLNHAGKIPHDQLIAMKRLLKKELERQGVSATAVTRDIPLDIEQLTDHVFTISHRVELGMFFEEIFSKRQGQRTDLTSQDGVHMSGNYPHFPTQLRPNLDEVNQESSCSSELLQQVQLMKGNFSIPVSKILKNKMAGRTDEAIAELTGFHSKSTYRSAKKVVVKGSAALIRAMDNQQVSIFQAYQLVDLPLTLQEELLQKSKKEITQYLRQVKKAENQLMSSNRKIRVLDLDIFQNQALLKAEQKYQLPLRFAFTGLMACCDSSGGFNWQPAELKELILPYTNLDFSQMLDALQQSGLIKKNEADGQFYGSISLSKQYVHEVDYATLVS